MTGNVTQTQCANSASSGAGCTIVDSAADSYGSGFAAAGGGVYVTELSEDGVKIWFFTVRIFCGLMMRCERLMKSDRPFRAKLAPTPAASTLHLLVHRLPITPTLRVTSTSTSEVSWR